MLKNYPRKWIKDLFYSIPKFRKARAHYIMMEQDRERVHQGNIFLSEEINFLKFRIGELDRLHDEVVLRHWRDDSFRKGLTCLSPFERLEILSTGDAYTCCSAHLKHNFKIGNIFNNDVDEIWNSDNARKLRYSVTAGNFEYCNHMCRWLHGDQTSIDESINPLRRRTPDTPVYEDYQECHLSAMPREISLSCDTTCNLTCPSCRTHLSVYSKEDSDRLYNRLMTIVRPMLKDCRHLSALGSGELFASSALTRFFQTLSAEEFPELKLLIITNGQLLTPKRWEKFSNLKGMPIQFAVSVDAAEQGVYETLRRGGSWERLNVNFEFLKELKQRGDVEKLTVNFLIQRENYKQIEPFALCAQRWGVDIVEYQRMANWGTTSDQEFARRDVMHPDHPLYEEVYASLKRVIDSDSGITFLTNAL